MDVWQEKEQAPDWTDATKEPLVTACHITHFSASSELTDTVCIVMAELPGTTNLENGGGNYA